VITPRVAFIVGSFNRPRRLRTCLASLLDQSLEEFEIVVTDNSDDPVCRREIEKLCQWDQRIRYEWTRDRCLTNFPRVVGASSVPQTSLYDAAEIGVGMTMAPWLVFPNCDSYYTSGFAEHVVRLAEQFNLQLVICNFVLGRDDTSYIPREAAPKIGSCDKTACLFRREIFPAQWPGKIGRYAEADGVLVEELVESGVRWGRFNPWMVCHN
jgi:glycosyltransferase involved in cell wall biosynthesis